MYNSQPQTDLQPQSKTLNDFTHVHNIFDSFIKGIIQNSFSKQIYTWGYAAMNEQNCPPNALEILEGQIKTKSTYNYLLKICSPGIKRPTELQDQNMNEKYDKFYQNPENSDKINIEKKKLAQMVIDHFPIIIPYAQISFFGNIPMSKQLVEYFNKLYSNLQGVKKFCEKLPRNQNYQIGKMMKPYEKKIRQGQQKQRNQQKRQIWLEQNQAYKQMMFKPAGYKKGKIKMTKSMYNKTEAQKTNNIQLFMKLIQQCVAPFFYSKDQQKCQTNGRYIPKNITTEVLIRKNAESKSSQQQKSTGSMSVQNIIPEIKPSISQMVPEMIPQISGQDKEDGELDSNKKSNKTKIIFKQKENLNIKASQSLKLPRFLDRLIKTAPNLENQKRLLKNRFSYFNYDQPIESIHSKYHSTKSDGELEIQQKNLFDNKLKNQVLKVSQSVTIEQQHTYINSLLDLESKINSQVFDREDKVSEIDNVMNQIYY